MRLAFALSLTLLLLGAAPLAARAQEGKVTPDSAETARERFSRQLDRLLGGESAVGAPESRASETEVPESGTPESEVPESEVPESEVPESEVPETSPAEPASDSGARAEPSFGPPPPPDRAAPSPAAPSPAVPSPAVPSPAEARPDPATPAAAPPAPASEPEPETGVETETGAETKTGAARPDMPPAGYEGEIAIDPELYESPFSDIDSGSALGEAAAFLYDTGVIGGYADGSFRPDRPLTRAAATKFIMRLHHDRLPQVANAGRIRDLPASAWFTPYMLAAVDEGYLRVPGNRLLRPGAPITLRAFFEMFARAANPPGSGRAKPDYSDRDLVDLATRFGLFPKSGVTTEELGRTVSRGEGVRALYNFAARPQLHYIGVRHGRYPVGHERGVGRCYRAFGRVEVTIRPGSKPIGLALAAHEPVIWEIELAPGAQIAKIWLGGYHLQRLEGVPEGVPVARHGYYRTVPPEAGEARWFVDSAEPDRGYYMGSCTAEELRADGAPPAPPESRRRYFHVASEGLFFSTYRQIEDCEDMFCRSQVQRDLETFRKLAGARISTFQGRYAGRHFILDPF